MGISMPEAAKLLWGRETSKERHVWGTVRSVNNDGTLEVSLNASDITTKCSKTCSAAPNDRVLVLIMNTSACVIGKRV